jgi:hypothetical protein
MGTKRSGAFDVGGDDIGAINVRRRIDFKRRRY